MADVPWESEESRNYICMQNIVADVVSEGLKMFLKGNGTLATMLALARGMTPVQVVRSCFTAKKHGKDQT